MIRYFLTPATVKARRILLGLSIGDISEILPGRQPDDIRRMERAGNKIFFEDHLDVLDELEECIMNSDALMDLVKARNPGWLFLYPSDDDLETFDPESYALVGYACLHNVVMFDLWAELSAKNADANLIHMQRGRYEKFLAQEKEEHSLDAMDRWATRVAAYAEPPLA